MLDKFAAHIRKKLKPFDTYFYCTLLLICGLIITIGSFCQIHQYSQQPVVVTEKLLSVGVDHVYQYGYKLEINGINYKIKTATYTKSTYGLPRIYNSKTLYTDLRHKLGTEFHLEYIPFAKNSKTLVALTVGDTVYVDKEIALKDYMGELNTFRWAGCIILVLTVAFIVFARKYIYR